MVKYTNAQEYIKNNYSDKENTTEIKFNSNNLNFDQEGELTIADYPNLKEIYKLKGKDLKNITKLTISNCPQLKEVNITNFVDNQQLEINNCPNLEILYCGNNKLTELNLNNCPNLTTLNCSENQLSNLDLTNCSQLTEIRCNQNKLEQLILPKLDNLQKLYY